MCIATLSFKIFNFKILLISISSKEKFSKCHNFFSWDFLNVIFLLKDAKKSALFNEISFEGAAGCGSLHFIPFLQKSRFFIKIYGFSKKNFAQNVQKFNVLYSGGVKKIDLYSYKNFTNFTKFNLLIPYKVSNRDSPSVKTSRFSNSKAVILITKMN